eukprot:TRINITY_DN50458_c0_g1_i1.p1 TRINITY_DN50458_c0_g1~~TRINITY_DN50458_c0_g1_i1.p1  ORF type:complete len:1108 (+),score=417.64 TRINITY_DN50458_c0_g1_i1:67-3324(+)
MARPAEGQGQMASLASQIAEEGDSDVDEDERGWGLDCTDVSPARELANLRYKYGVYLSFTLREVRKRKVACCLGVCSCFLVVLTTALLITTLANLPMVFLRLAETENSERDLVLWAGGDAHYAYTLDYRKVAEAADTLGDKYSYHSPRVTLPSSGSQTMAFSVADCRVDAPLRAPPFPDKLLFGYYGPGRTEATQQCPNSARGCVPLLCTGHEEEAEVHVIDTKAEQRQGLGRSWPYGPIGRGDCIIDSDLAGLLGVKKGDYVLISSYLAPHLLGVFTAAGLERTRWPYSSYGVVHFPVRVAELTSDSYGKLENGAEKFLFMEFEHFISYVAEFVNPAVTPEQRQIIATADLARYASSISVSLAPKERKSTYNQNDYAVVQLAVIEWAATLLYRVGFNQLDTSAEVLSFMQESRFFSLFLGLLISLVILVLTALSVLLIYSLLMINVETRTFELGVLRMVGMRRSELIQLVLTQAFFYALPAWTVGLIVGQVVWYMVRQALQESLLMELSTGLDGFAVGIATLVGIGIPLLSSVIPIQSALQLNLQDALDTRHSKTKAVEFQFERAEGTTFSPSLVVLGTALAMFGFLIYYLFPLALLEFNLSLLFYIFFGILLGLLFGLVLLSLNFEHMLETALTHFFFFWENRAVRTVVLKNLVAHRRRNRKTTLMYAVSLAFIIWISVSWELQTRAVEYRRQQQMGGPLLVQAGGGSNGALHPDEASVVEQLFETRSDLVRDWAWVTNNLNDLDDIEGETVQNVGRYIIYKRPRTRGVAPNLLEGVADDSFLKVRSSNASLATALSHQLYTSWGSERAVISSLYDQQMHLGGHSFALEVEKQTADGDEEFYVNEVWPLATLDAAPLLLFSQFPARRNQDLMVSIPSWIALSQGSVRSMDEVRYERGCVALQSGWTSDDLSQLRVEVANALRDRGIPSDAVQLRDVLTETKAVRTASGILTVFFFVITLITMVMCFFSLTASMYTNVHEQSKEIGILRSLGLRTATTKRLYVWEAFILVVSASTMGFLVGTLVAWTMTIQRQLFLQLPLKFHFPWDLFVFVIAMALIFSFLASYGPTTRLLRHSVVTILRRQD